jgi:hypothetical protein
MSSSLVGIKHPIITNSTLYSSVIPAGVTEAQLKGLSHASIEKPIISFQGLSIAHVEKTYLKLDFGSAQAGAFVSSFGYLQTFTWTAEVYYAWVNGNMIPGTFPLCKMTLRSTPPDESTVDLVPASDGYLIGCSTKDLPDILKLFRHLRQFGPIYALRNDCVRGWHVQFFENAKPITAKEGEAMADGKKLTFEPFELNAVICEVTVVIVEARN